VQHFFLNQHQLTNSTFKNVPPSMRTSFLFFILLPVSLAAQNFIVNGGFERQTPRQSDRMQAPIAPCQFASNPNRLNDNAIGWTTFDVMTPDLLLWDTVAACPALPRPHRGNRMVGLIMYHPFQDGKFTFDYHELIQGRLAKPLEPGKTYRVSFWTRTNDSLGVQHLREVFGRVTNVRSVKCGNFGFYFSNGKINPKENFMLSQLDFSLRPQVNFTQIVETGDAWRQYSMLFKADRPYQYFLFGNFFSDAVTPLNMDIDERQKIDETNTATVDFWKKTKRIAYYCFDDFVVEAYKGEVETLEKTLLEKKTYTFESALLFDTGQSDLKAGSEPELLRLAAFLKTNPAIRLEIGGHTDDIGDDTSNFLLSERRARAVSVFLERNGIPPAQLRATGYGESHPVAANDTENGRQQNRRVECRQSEQ